MSGRAGALTRAGLFLLFVAVLAILAPVPPAQGSTGPQRTSSEETSKTQTNEHRDGEKLRERLPNATPYRRPGERHPRLRDLLPEWLQPISTRDMQPPRVAECRSASADDRTRTRHAPAALQVFRR